MSERPTIEVRTASVTEVRHPERIVELVAVPWEEWTTIEYRGRVIEEQFARGAFGNVQNRADRFIVNLEHDLERRVGRCVSLDPERPEGLVAEIRIRRGPEGDQVLDDAADGMLGASVGFGAKPADTEWPSRDRRRIVKAFLDHIALTWTPAYTGAGVIAVRKPTPDPLTVPTPHLDAIRAQRLEVAYRALSSH